SGTQIITVNTSTAGPVTLSGGIGDGATGGQIGLTVANPLTSGTVISTVNLTGTNTFSGPVVVGTGATGTALSYLIVQSSTALGNTPGVTVNGVTNAGGSGNRLTLNNGVVITGKTLTLNGGAQRAALFTTGGTVASWEGNVVV